MSAPAFRNQPVDRRRLSAEDRQSYNPRDRMSALAKAKSFKSSWASQHQRKPFATEQKPGTGGFTQGIAMQQERLRAAGQEERRAQSFRPENAVSSEIYDKLAT